MAVDIRGLSKRFGENEVLDSVSLRINDGEFISLIGPSGVGKTTLLKILADLETPNSGMIRFSEPPSKARPVIMVFQDFALFPHMNIAENIGYGLKVRGVHKKHRMPKVKTMLDWFGLSDKAHDYPAHISAGQKQRAAIARALIVEPMILLLDEPFANLDKNLKGETAEFIRRTQKSFDITTVMVTHDQEEAFSVSDRIGVLIGGVLKQYASPEVLVSSPADPDVARFLGQGNALISGSKSSLGPYLELSERNTS
ncbi:MAG: ABC transporter ATP-binding protein [Spirochaetaceae bacterium]|nr:ABC transporter ATP-binding protein [Spirochaetaceae bacterium]MDT8297012.1 ABC transporter ATP-binding protein [Spirochaetaceae bacterium]